MELSPFEKSKQDYLDSYKDYSDETPFKVTITFDNKRQLTGENDKNHVAWLLACFANKVKAGFSYHEGQGTDAIIDFSKVTDILVEKEGAEAD